MQKFHASPILALLLYIVLALVFFGRSGSWTTHFFGSDGDPLTYVWFIHWWPFAFAHGINPFISYYVWAPHGDNLVWRASSPTAALLGLPFTLLGGPVLAFNILSMLAPALSAWATYLLTHHLTFNRQAAFAGGFFYGFSSYETAQMLGRALFIFLVILSIASIGPWLHISGVKTEFWLPWRLVGHLPFVKEALPVRFSMYISLISAIVVARYLSAPGFVRLRRFALVAIAAIFLIPDRTEYPWSPWPRDDFFTL